VELKEAVDLFLDSQSETTRESYKYPLLYFQEWIGPSREIETIKPSMLLEYQNQSLKKRKYADATRVKHVKTIKTLFNWLVKLDELEKSPARVLKTKRLPMYISRDKAITDNEYAALLDYTRWKLRDHALLLFLADTGCRISGAAGLRVRDLDIAKRRGSVTEKGEKTRPVRFGERCAAALARWLLTAKRRPDDSVFGRTAQPMKADNISLMIRRACKAVGIRVVSGHAFRHRKGHQLADQKTPITLAARILGHSDPMITAAHYYPADWESAEKEADKTMTAADLHYQEPKPIIHLNDHQRAK
jgi:site-specific recombinase XerD